MFLEFSSLQRLFTAMEHCQATPCDITGLLIECNVPTDPGFGEGPVDASLSAYLLEPLHCSHLIIHNIA